MQLACRKGKDCDPYPEQEQASNSIPSGSPKVDTTVLGVTLGGGHLDPKHFGDINDTNRYSGAFTDLPGFADASSCIIESFTPEDATIERRGET